MFQAIAMVISLAIRLAYWTFKATIMLIAAIAGAISTSRRRKPFHSLRSSRGYHQCAGMRALRYSSRSRQLWPA
jgi:hypothetical protein